MNLLIVCTARLCSARPCSRIGERADATRESRSPRLGGAASAQLVGKLTDARTAGLRTASSHAGKRCDAHGCEGDRGRGCGRGARVRALEGEEHRDPAAPGAHLRGRDPPWCRMASSSPCAPVAGDLLLLRARARRNRAVLLAGRAAGAAPAFAGAPPKRPRCHAESLHRGPTRRPRLGRPPTPRASTRIEAAPPDRRVRAQGNECGRRHVLHAGRYVVLGLRARSDDRAARGDRTGIEARQGQADLPRDRPPARVIHPPEVLDGRDRRRGAGRGLLPRRARLLAA
jgi:hypothetical protein